MTQHQKELLAFVTGYCTDTWANVSAPRDGFTSAFRRGTLAKSTRTCLEWTTRRLAIAGVTLGCVRSLKRFAPRRLTRRFTSDLNMGGNRMTEFDYGRWIDREHDAIRASLDGVFRMRGYTSDFAVYAIPSKGAEPGKLVVSDTPLPLEVVHFPAQRACRARPNSASPGSRSGTLRPRQSPA